MKINKRMKNIALSCAITLSGILCGCNPGYSQLEKLRYDNIERTALHLRNAQPRVISVTIGSSEHLDAVTHHDYFDIDGDGICDQFAIRDLCKRPLFVKYVRGKGYGFEHTPKEIQSEVTSMPEGIQKEYEALCVIMERRMEPIMRYEWMKDK